MCLAHASLTFRSGFVFFCLDPGDDFFSLFTLLDQLLPGAAFGNSYLGKERSLKIMAACFHQGDLGHTAWASECYVPKSFYERLNGLSLSLFSSQKGGHRDFRVILEEAR